MKQKLAIYLILISSILLSFDSNAQVTIGSSQPSGKGALLDLKEEIITQKGLGLPRVKLLYLTIPNGQTSLSTTIDQATGDWDKKDHIGLLIYHSGEFDVCDPNSIPIGPYVWDGNKWQYLGEKAKRSPYVEEFEDPRDGEVYLYRNFGQAGDWMLENMRHLPSDGSIELSQPDDDTEGYTLKRYFPPNGYSNDKRLGLLYTYAAATMGEQDDVEEDQGTEGGPHNPVTGICPPGWHVPSDYEWNQLEEEIHNNAYKYSQYSPGNGFPFIPEKWDEDWNSGEGPRGPEPNYPEGHGKAILSKCPPYGNKEPTKGKSLQAEQGGFEAFLVGVASNGVIENYGIECGFWTSSTAALESAWFRLLGTQGQAQQVVRGYYPRIALTSVRCKR